MSTPFVKIPVRGKAPLIVGWPTAAPEDLAQPHPMATGWGLRLDKILVVDLDGPDAIAMWNEAGLPMPSHRTRTPGRGGGMHLFFQAPEYGADLSNVNIPAGDGQVEVKTGFNRQVVIPPSPHPDGGVYEWVGDAPSSVEDLAVLDPDTIRWLRDKNRHGSTEETEWGAVVDQGQRHSFLVSVATAARHHTESSAESVWRAVTDANRDRCLPPMDEDEVERIVRWAMRNVEPDEPIVLLPDEPTESLVIRLDRNIPIPERPEWLWEPYIPEGRLVLVDGAAGIGKGLFVAWAAVEAARNGVPVLWFASEDDPYEDVNPRLRAVGHTDETPIFVAGFRPTFPQQESIDLTAKVIEEHGIGLIIMDPGRSFLGHKGKSNVPFNNNSDSDVRPALESVQRLAHSTKTSILFVHHWNRDGTRGARERYTGASAYQEVPRHRITFVSKDDAAAFAVTKSNITKWQHTVHTYDIGERQFTTGLQVPYFRPGSRRPEYLAVEDWVKDTEETINFTTGILDSLITEAVAKGVAPGPVGSINSASGNFKELEAYKRLSRNDKVALGSYCKMDPRFYTDNRGTVHWDGSV